MRYTVAGENTADQIEFARTMCEDRRQRCRVCRCTNLRGCANGCWWVEEDLCSNCVGKVARQ